MLGFEARDTGSGPTITGHINPDLIIFDVERKTEFHEISDVVRLFRSLHIRRGQGAYYLPAVRSGIMQSQSVIGSILIKRATHIGLDRFEASTFSGMIADFLEQVVNYKERKGVPDSIHQVAGQLEAELLEGKIEVERATPEASPTFLYRPEQAEETLRMNHSSAMVSELAPLVLLLRGTIKQGDLLITKVWTFWDIQAALSAGNAVSL